MANKTLASVMTLRKMLPAGTLTVFQLLAPLLTNNGECHRAHKYATGALLLSCALSCFLSTFTDSFTGANGKASYGIATMKGMYVFGDGGDNCPDLSAYRLRLSDFVHAFFSVFVFAAVALLDSNTSTCYYPAIRTEEKALNIALPPAISAIASVFFLLFPNKRHNIGTQL